MPHDGTLHEKYRVERTDGDSAPGGQHDGCEYFVLDMTHDPSALAAVHAFAADCEADRPELAASIRERWPMPPLARKPSRWRPLKLSDDTPELDQ